MLHKLIYIHLRPLERQCPNTIQAYYRAIIHTFEAYQKVMSKYSPGPLWGNNTYIASLSRGIV